MDTDAIARERRRREALDALEFERQREAALREQVEEIVLERERARIDADALAQLDPADAARVREVLGDDVTDMDGADEDDDAGWDDELVTLDEDEDGDGEGADGDDDADELERLATEIEASLARQRALERFAEALAHPSPLPREA